MRHICIDVDVWARYHREAPVYRVYVDNELLTERTFIWENTRHFVREHIEVFLEPGEWHEVRVENCTPELGSFVLDNVVVNGAKSAAKFVAPF